MFAILSPRQKPRSHRSHKRAFPSCCYPKKTPLVNTGCTETEARPGVYKKYKTNLAEIVRPEGKSLSSQPLVCTQNVPCGAETLLSTSCCLVAPRVTAVGFLTPVAPAESTFHPLRYVGDRSYGTRRSQSDCWDLRGSQFSTPSPLCALELHCPS